MEQYSRRAFIGATLAGLATPSIVRAQSLSHRDIWTKIPSAGILRSSVVLGFDTSASMKGDEPAIQREGTAQAIEHPNLRYAVKNRTADGYGGVAVCCATFNTNAKIISPDGIYSGRGHELVGVTQSNWAVLETDDDVDQMASFIRTRIPLYTEGGTNICDALKIGQQMHRISPYATSKKVIDISGDGVQNTISVGQNISPYERDVMCRDLVINTVADLAITDGITVNAFAMIGENDEPPLLEIDGTLRPVQVDEYFERYLQTQFSYNHNLDSGFTIRIHKGDGMRTAYPIGMTRKLLREFT